MSDPATPTDILSQNFWLAAATTPSTQFDESIVIGSRQQQ
jgi:hypothetical protein